MKNQTVRANAQGLNSMIGKRPSAKKFGRVLGYFIIIFCSMQIFKELLQLAVLRFKYFLSFVNYLEVTLYASTLFYITSYLFKTRLNRISYEVGCICTFLGWVNVMFFLQRVPMFRIVIVMFIQVCLTIVKVLLVFSTVILSFILTFYMLFMKQSSFSDLTRTTTKVLVMMTGEFEYDTIITGNLRGKDATTNFPLVPYPHLTYVVFIVFVFLVALAFSNLLVGIA